MANEVKIEISLDEKQALKALGRLQKEVDESASSTTKAFKKIDMAVASFAGNLAADLAGKALTLVSDTFIRAADAAVEFEKAIAEVNTLLPESKRLNEDLVDALSDLSGNYGTTQTKQAESFYQVISSGAAEGAAAVKLLDSANKLALGGLADLTDSVDVLTDIVNVYGQENINTDQAANTLFATVKLGKTNIQELSTTMGQVLPSAERLGVSLEDLGGALATMTVQGLSTGQRVTQLQALFSALFKKSGDAGKKFGKEVGEAFSLTALRTKGLTKFLEDLNTATGGNELVLQELLGRAEAVNAVFALTGKNSQKLASNIADIKKNTDALTQAAEVNANTFSQQWAEATQKVSNIFGKWLSPAIDLATSALKSFNEALEETPEEKAQELADMSKEAEKLGKSIKHLEGLSYLPPSEEARLEGMKDRLQEINKILDEQKRKKEEAAKSDDAFVGPPRPPEPPKPDPRVIEFKKQQNETLLALEKERIAKEGELAKLQYEAMKEGREMDLATRQEEYALEKEIKLLQDEEKVAQEAKTKEKLAELDMKFKGEQLKRDLDANKKKEKADKEAAEKKKKLDEQAKQAYFANKQAEINIASNAAGLITAVSGKETKAAFLISKAAAAAQVVIDTQRANMLARAQLGTFAEPVVLRQNIAGGIALATIAATTLQGFADGGVVGGGATTGGDNRTITARDGEMILNADQQANLFNGINGGGMGGDIVIEIDGREIARAVRDQRQQGFSA